MKKIQSFLSALFLLISSVSGYASASCKGGEAADPGKPAESNNRFTLPIGFPFGVTHDSSGSFVKKDTSRKVIKGQLPSKKKVYQFNITDDNTTASWRQTEEAFRQAQDMNADFILIHVDDNNAYNTANKIRSQLFHYKTPVLLYVENKNAPSNSIFPLNEDTLARLKTGTLFASNNSQGPYASDSRHRNGYATRQKNTFIELKKCRKNDDGTCYVVDPQESNSAGISMNEVLQNAGLNDFDIINYKPTAIGGLVDSLAGSWGSFVLILLFAAGLYLETRSISNGLPLFVSVCALLLLFTSHYFEGRMLWWEAALFLTGIGSLLWNIYYSRRSFLVGIPSVLLTVIGITLGITGTDPLTLSISFSDDVLQSLAIVLSSLTLSFFLCRKIERMVIGRIIRVKDIPQTELYSLQLLSPEVS